MVTKQDSKIPDRLLPGRTLPPIGFWKRFEVKGDSECWPWTGGRKRDGYAVYAVRVHGQHRTVVPARIMYGLVNGRLLPGQVVRHACDNPPCVNPRHLLAGTQADNIRDMVERGRQGKYHTFKPKPRICVVCGDGMMGNATRIYCSKRCNQRAFVARQRAR